MNFGTNSDADLTVLLSLSDVNLTVRPLSHEIDGPIITVSEANLMVQTYCRRYEVHTSVFLCLRLPHWLSVPPTDCC